MESKDNEQHPSPKEFLRKELHNRLESLFDGIKVSKESPLNAGMDEENPNSKSFYGLNVDRKIFSNNGVGKSICQALFADQGHANFVISLGKHNIGILLQIENRDTDLPFEEKYLTLGSTVDGNNPFLIAVPAQSRLTPDLPVKDRHTYKPKSIEKERADCFAVIKAVEAIAKQGNLIKG